MFTIAEFESKGAEPKLVNFEDDTGKLFDEIDLFLGGRIKTDQERSYSGTSFWMNRGPIGEGYVLIPADIGHPYDIAKTVKSRFVIFKHKGGPLFEPMGQEDVAKINAVLDRLGTPEGSKKYSEEKMMDTFYGIIYQEYRAIYSLMKDEHIEMIRNALQNDTSRCWEWAGKLEAFKKAEGIPCEDEKERLFFEDFVIAEKRAALSAYALSKGTNAGFLNFRKVLTDERQKEMLIEALDPESIGIFRSFMQS